MIKLLLGIDPIPKGRPRFFRNIVITPPETRRFENAVRVLIRAQYAGLPLKTALKAKLTFYVGCPARRPSKSKKNYHYPAVRPDWDNLAKAVCDSANGLLWEDDGQLVDVHVLKFYDWANRKTGIEIELQEITEGEK